MFVSKTKESRDSSTVIFAEKDKEQLPRTIRFFLPKPKGLHYIFKYIKPNKFNLQGNPFECYLWVSGNSGNPWWLSGKESTCQRRRCRRHRFDSWVWKMPWRRKEQPTPVFIYLFKKIFFSFFFFFPLQYSCQENSSKKPDGL